LHTLQAAVPRGGGAFHVLRVVTVPELEARLSSEGADAILLGEGLFELSPRTLAILADPSRPVLWRLGSARLACGCAAPIGQLIGAALASCMVGCERKSNEHGVGIECVRKRLQQSPSTSRLPSSVPMSP
jgi:hypothetical protein